MIRGLKRIIIASSCLVLAISPLIIKPARAIGTMESGRNFIDHCQVRRAEPLNRLGAQTANRKSTPLTPGVWGGEHIRVEVTDDGGNGEFDCAHATISRKIILDRHGRFSVPGFYVAEHGGPVRQDEQADNIPVQFSGRVKGQQMSVIIKRRDSGKLLGAFNLILGKEASLVRCR